MYLVACAKLLHHFLTAQNRRIKSRSKGAPSAFMKIIQQKTQTRGRRNGTVQFFPQAHLHASVSIIKGSQPAGVVQIKSAQVIWVAQVADAASFPFK